MIIGKVLLVVVFLGLIFSSSIILYYLPIGYSLDSNIKIIEEVRATIHDEPVIYGLPTSINIPINVILFDIFLFVNLLFIVYLFN